MEKDSMSETMRNPQERPRRCRVDIKSEFSEACTEPPDDTQYTSLKNMTIIRFSFTHGVI